LSDIHLDSAVLAALQDVMEDEYPVLLDTFLIDSEERLLVLRQAEQAADAQSLRLAAHSFKGSCINIGAPRLGELCFEAEKAGRDLAGATTRERYEILQWMFWSGEQWRVFATLTFDEVLAKRFVGLPADETIVQLAFAKIRAAAAVLDAHLADRQFIVGDRLTLADLDIAGPFSQNERTKIPLNEFPNLVAWQQRLLKTAPAWAATKQEVDARIDGALDAAGIKL